MILTASKYAAVPSSKERVRQAVNSFCVLVKKARARQTFRDWMWTELKEGGWLRSYLNGEKHNADRRWRQVARHVHGRKQNNKCDFRAVAHVPMRDWLRWKRVDEDFWNDNSNLRSLKRDVPDAQIFV